MLTFAAVMFFVLTTSYNLSKLTKLTISDYIPISIFIAMIWTTLFGLFDALLIGAIALIPATIVLSIVLAAKKSNFLNRESLAELVSLPIVFFVFLAGWAYQHSQRWQFSEWDEFTHWGLVVKAMDYYDVLGPASPTSLNSSEYPPGLAVISYLVMKIGGKFDEADVLWAYQLLFISLLIPVLKSFNYRKFFTFVFSFMILIFSSVTFYNTFQTVYSDPILAMVFGYSLFLATSRETIANKYAYLNLIIVVISMMLIKDIAIYFAAIPVLIFAINKYIAEKSIEVATKTAIFKFAYRLILSFAVIFFTRFVWTFFVSQSISTNASETEFSKATSQLSLTNLSGTANYAETKSTFLERVFNGGPIEITDHDKIIITGFRFNTIDWILIFIVIFALIILVRKSRLERIQELINSSIIVAGAFGYLFVLFLIYLIVYSGANTRSLISYDRYVSTYLAGVLFYLGMVSVMQLAKFTKDLDKSREFSNAHKTSSIPAVAICLTILLFFQTKTEYVVSYLLKPTEFSEIRRGEFRAMADKIQFAKFDNSDRVWIIAQHTMGFEFYLLQYEAFPANVGRIPYSIGTPAFYGDPWTDPNMTLEKWDQALNNYDYVIVFKSTESFLAEYGDLFEDKNSLVEQGIYRIDHSPNGNKLIKHI
jgi:hypothetical protein